MIYFELKSTQLVKAVDQQRFSVCMQLFFPSPLAYFLKSFCALQNLGCYAVNVSNRAAMQIRP